MLNIFDFRFVKIAVSVISFGLLFGCVGNDMDRLLEKANRQIEQSKATTQEHERYMNSFVPSQYNIDHSNYGSPKSDQDFVALVRQTLLDPDSGKINCNKPIKGWALKWIPTNTYSYGYFSTCIIHAKNTFGGYAQPQTHTYCLEGSGEFNKADYASVHPVS